MNNKSEIRNAERIISGIVMTLMFVIMFISAGCIPDNNEDLDIMGVNDELTPEPEPQNKEEYINLEIFDVAPAEIHKKDSFILSWDVDYSAYMGFFTLEFHLNNEPELIEGASAFTKIMNLNCGQDGMMFDKTDNIECSYDIDWITGYQMITCPKAKVSRYLNTVDISGDSYMICKACFYDSKMNTTCSQKTKKIWLEPSD